MSCSSSSVCLRSATSSALPSPPLLLSASASISGGTGDFEYILGPKVATTESTLANQISVQTSLTFHLLLQPPDFGDG